MAAFYMLTFAVVSQCAYAAIPKCSIKFDIDICVSNKSERYLNVKCSDVPTCSRRLSITYLHFEPYTTDIVRSLVQRCCGSCPKHNYSDEAVIQDNSQIPDVHNSSSTDFVFPVLGRFSAHKLFGYHFIPLIRPPALYYYTAKDKDVIKKLIVHCLYMWPLFLICSFLVALAGFISWAVETKKNPTEFPPSFFSGWMSGCWWSFVTMTTLGYGDKVPKSVTGRCFAVGWTLVGITTFSLITAMLASQLTVLNTAGQPAMAGGRIGVLKHRAYDTTAVAVRGGIAVASNRLGRDGIVELIGMLKRNEIDGFLLDRYILITFHSHMSNISLYANDVTFLQTETVRSEVHATTDENLSYGILVKNEEDYDYFHDFVVDNEHVISACNALLLNQHTHDIGMHQVLNPLFSPRGEFFWPSFICGVILLAGILCYGAVYERNRRKKSKYYDGHSV